MGVESLRERCGREWGELLEERPMSEKSATAWEKWKELAKRAATWQARVLLACFYWVCVTPFACVVRLCSDPLETEAGGRGGRWREHSSSIAARNQY